MDLLFEMKSGIAGDMTIGALLSLGADKNQLIRGINQLNIEGYTLRFDEREIAGKWVYDFDVIIADDYCGYKRYLKDVKQIIGQTSLSDHIKENALNMFNILAQAEAKAHKIPIDRIEFHEVGAIDTLIDIVGISILIDDLSPNHVYFSDLYDGKGFITYRYGKLPVPVPAVKNIAKAYQLTIHQLDEAGEHITPTGATIIANFKGKDLPDNPYHIDKIGYGLGNRVFDSGHGMLTVKKISWPKH